MLPSGRLVPVAYQGFVWQPEDFCTFMPVGSYDSHRLSEPLCVGGCWRALCRADDESQPRHPFTNIAQPFAATAVVAPWDANGVFCSAVL